MYKKIALLTVGIIAFLFLVAHFHSASATSELSTDAPANLVLSPGNDITLMAGEKVELSVFDNRIQQAVDAAKINWSVNGQAMGQVDPALGILTLSASSASPSTVTYKSPAKTPANRTLTIAAGLSDAGAPVELKGNITITDEPNWFSIDGDTKLGHQDVSIQLNPQIPSAAGFGALPYGLQKDEFLVHIVGSQKGSPQSDLTVDLDMGQNSKPGTYAWHANNPSIGATIGLSSARVGYVSFDLGPDASAFTLGGSTTLMKPDASQPGLVKGFYSGRLKWGEFVGQTNVNHYLIRLHDD